MPMPASAGLDYDSELRKHRIALSRALLIQRGDRVLDIGCGTGQTTRDAARMAGIGSATGIDTALQALRTARQLTQSAGVQNVRYVCGDAARLPFPRESFDIAISRFGTMFFGDPIAAFRNIRGCLRPRGRLVMMVWQTAERNEWTVAIHRALTGNDSAIPKTPCGPSAFSLGDEQTVRNTLRDAGFADVSLSEVHERVYYGADAASAYAFVSAFANVKSALESQSHAERTLTNARLHATMAEHQTRDGVWFDSRAWIVSAQCG